MLPEELSKARIRQTVRLIERKEREMEDMRQQLNQQIMFNLKDVFINISKGQQSITMKELGRFMKVEPSQSVALEKMVLWNNHNSSLNLNFAQFSGTLISKQDRLLAKVVLQRQQMGAIPNFLLDSVRLILLKQLQIHQWCINCGLTEDWLKQWVESVTNQSGQIDIAELESVLKSARSTDSEEDSVAEDNNFELFMSFIGGSDNRSANGLLFLWKDLRPDNTQLCQFSCKFNKLSTTVSSPKSVLFSPKSDKMYRSEYFDVFNRPQPEQTEMIRQEKSIQRHIKRVGSNHKLSAEKKAEQENIKQQRSLLTLILKLKEILAVQRALQETKIELCICPDFYPVLFYDSITKDRSTMSVTPYNLRDYLDYFGCQTDLSAIFLLFKRHSRSSSDQNLTFNHFCAIFDVSRSQFALLHKDRYIQSLQDVSVSTKKIFFATLTQAISTQRTVNQIKKELASLGKYLNKSIQLLFDGLQAITQEGLQQAIQLTANVKFSVKQLNLLWSRLGLPPNQDHLMTKALLRSELVPQWTK